MLRLGGLRCLVLLGLLALPLSARAAPVVPGRALVDPAFFVHLPLVTRGGVGLFGTVTENGVPVAGVALKLNRTSDGTLIATTTTAADGTYSFPNAPTLGAGQRYQVEFSNTSNSSRLRRWTTEHLYSYTASQAVHMGNFDVANIALLEPADGAAFSAAQDFFKWVKRNYPADDYALFFHRSGFALPSALGGGYGWVDEKFIGSPPPGFTTGVAYAWTVHIIGPEGKFGTNFSERAICFSSCPASQAGYAAPALPRMAWLALGRTMDGQ